ncbi:MAG: tripartite tricarboxylate transporter TctB family protein [Limnochordia bacterium]|jgi:hypothetical protein
MLNTDTLAGGFILLLSVGAYLGSQNLNELSGLFVWCVTAILFVLGAILFVQGLLHRSGEKPTGDWIPVLQFMAIVAIYLWLITAIGFALASILFFSFTTWFLSRQVQEEQPVLRIIGTGFGVTMLFFITFKFLLSVPLPSGFIWG